MQRWKRRAVLLVVFALSATGLSTRVQGQMSQMEKAPTPVQEPKPIRITMDQLHAQGGVPRGWKFSIPRGDAAEGRKVFIAMECFACHDVTGEDFPQDSKRARDAGPPLTGMGSHHPPEYFAESIMNPNRVIVLGSGYTGADQLSKMPSYADTMTVRQLIDVVAYLRSLADGTTTHGAHSSGGSSAGHDHMKMK